MKFEFDFNYIYDPQWYPEGCNIRPWFLPEGMGKYAYDIGEIESICYYRSEKLLFVRKMLEGVDRQKVLLEIIEHIWKGANTNQERFNRIVAFVQHMMIHPMAEQPMEPDAARTIRGFRGDMLAYQAEPYPEDLKLPWLVKAYTEARLFGKYLGAWCNPLRVTMDGDWGMAGMVTDAMELLLLHEGRCGQQAAVVVQLAQVGGLRSRLVQVNHHRVAEVYVDGKWCLADPDALALNFLATNDKGEPASVEWCINNVQQLECWSVRHKSDIERGYQWYFKNEDN